MLPVSVIIPTYNRAEFLPRAMNSVLKQTRSCSEIIVVNDGSTDNTTEVVENILSCSKTPYSILNQKNKGPSAARNNGVKKARFPYVAFLDSDDHWKKRKLEIQFKALNENRNYLICHTYEKWLRRGEHLNQKKIHIPREGYIFDHCVMLCAVGMSTVMVRKELFDDIGFFDESLRCCEDYDFWLRTSSKFEFLLVNQPLTVKEGGREDQVSHMYRLGMDKLRLYSLKKLLRSDALSEQQCSIALQEFERKSLIFGNGCIKHGSNDIGTDVLQELAEYKQIAFKKYPHLRKALDD